VELIWQQLQNLCIQIVLKHYWIQQLINLKKTSFASNSDSVTEKKEEAEEKKKSTEQKDKDKDNEDKDNEDKDKDNEDEDVDNDNIHTNFAFYLL